MIKLNPCIDLNVRMIEYVIKSNFEMLKNRNTISSTKISKRPQRPVSSGTFQSKKSRLSLQVNHIISSLERNVKDLKTYYHQRQQSRHAPLSLEKNKSAFRLKKVLRRNGSQTNLVRPHSQAKDKGCEENMGHSDCKDRALSDIFQIKVFFRKMYGRDTNSVVQLYEFYKKNMEKRDKSTRILASIDMSNPTMGLSLDAGKQSWSRNQQTFQQRLQRQDNKQSAKKIRERLQEESKGDHSSKLGQVGNQHLKEKPSTLASQLISKGLYNVANVANLMLNKKYKLTKEKEESFQKAQKQKTHKTISLKLDNAKQNEFNKINIQAGGQEIKVGKEYKPSSKKAKEEGNSLSSAAEVKRNLDANVSFNQEPISQSSKESEQRSVSDAKKGSIEKISDIEPFQASSIKKPQETNVKIEEISGLEQSPIVPQKGKDFCKSKYYVQPIPSMKKKQIEEDKSLTLKSQSRIIDMDLLPFDL